eukprot:351801-Chlamydomonas_euryale.AAC.23
MDLREEISHAVDLSDMLRQRLPLLGVCNGCVLHGRQLRQQPRQRASLIDASTSTANRQAGTAGQAGRPGAPRARTTHRRRHLRHRRAHASDARRDIAEADLGGRPAQHITPTRLLFGWWNATNGVEHGGLGHARVPASDGPDACSTVQTAQRFLYA